MVSDKRKRLYIGQTIGQEGKRKMTTLFYEKHGCRKRVNVIGKNDERLILDISGFDFYQYRTENKRTGKPLQKPVKELKQANKLWIDGCRYFMAKGNDPAALDIYEDCRGFHGRMYLQNDYCYTDSEMLQAVEDITGQHYDNMQEINKVPLPDKWMALKAQEEREARENAIENRARDLAENIQNTQSLKCFDKYFQVMIEPKLREFEKESGSSPEDIKRIAKQLKKSGSFRENNYFYSSYRAAVKLPRNDLFRIYNLIPDSHGVIHYFEITKDGRITG